MERSVVLGPPGTGKTSYVARQAARAAEKYGAEKILLLSLTRAAAAAIGSAIRALGFEIPERNVGTLHSHCFHILDRPKIIKQKDLARWNEQYPQWRIEASFSDDGPEEHESNWFSEIEHRRHRLITTAADSSFLGAWRSWQAEHGVSEFTSLIESCLHRQYTFDPQPAVIFCDEYQDFSDLEIAVIEMWAHDAEHLVVVGDPCQSIYGWRGASPTAMPDPTVRLLQSHRIPRAVWEEARRVLPGAPQDLVARDADGLFERGPSRLEARYYIERMKECAGSWMFLFACQYMADQFAGALRMDGIPYWNPFDARRWNPLKLSIDRGVTGAQRVRAFMEDFSTERVKLWKPLFANVFERGSDDIIALLRDDDPPRAVREAVLSVTKPEHREWIGDLDCIEAQHHLAAAHKRAAYLLDLGAKGGVSIFSMRPQAIVGTIHSVKGGEADHVVVFPDISPKQWDQLQEPGWDGREAVLRTFYVAMTRARESLTMGIPSGGYHL